MGWICCPHEQRYAYSAGRFRFRLRFRESAQRMAFVLTVQVRIVVAGSCGSVQTVGVRRFTGIISSFLFRLSESESEPQSACTIRVPYLGRVVRRKVSHKTGRPFGRPRRRGGGDMRVELQQDKHRTYNVTQRRVRATIVAVEKQ